MGDSPSRNLLLIVARAPLPGTTKTRLGATIGMERAALLHRAFLTDLVHRFSPEQCLGQGFDVGWSFTPPDYDFRALITQIAPQQAEANWQFAPQEGDRFGDRLSNAISWATRNGYERTILMASDSPQLALTVATDGFALLHSADLVLGRVTDGGYYLVGIRGHSDILAHVPMSTDDAASALVQTARERGMTVRELPSDFDVDLSADLTLLVKRLESEPALAPETLQALRRLDLCS